MGEFLTKDITTKQTKQDTVSNTVKPLNKPDAKKPKEAFSHNGVEFLNLDNGMKGVHTRMFVPDRKNFEDVCKCTEDGLPVVVQVYVFDKQCGTIAEKNEKGSDVFMERVDSMHKNDLYGNISGLSCGKEPSECGVPVLSVVIDESEWKEDTNKDFPKCFTEAITNSFNAFKGYLCNNGFDSGKLRDKFVIKGYSAGGDVAAQYTMANPDKVCGAFIGGATSAMPVASDKVKGPLGLGSLSEENKAVFKNIPIFYIVGGKEYDVYLENSFMHDMLDYRDGDLKPIIAEESIAKSQFDFLRSISDIDSTDPSIRQLIINAFNRSHDCNQSIVVIKDAYHNPDEDPSRRFKDKVFTGKYESGYLGGFYFNNVIKGKPLGVSVEADFSGGGKPVAKVLDLPEIKDDNLEFGA